MALPRFAIVGTGAMAATMATLFRKVGIPLAAVASQSAERAAAFAKNFSLDKGESDLDSILARSDVDAIYIANAASEHAATVVAALNAGKAVLCEKPMITSEEEHAAVLHAAQQSNVLCMEGLWTLCLPSYRQFFDHASSGKWGVPQSLNASFAYPTGQLANQRSHAANRAGVLLDRSVYLIALALNALGPVEEVDAQIHFDQSGTDIEAFLQLKHLSGAHSQLASSFSCLMPNTAALNCSRGLIEINAPLIGSESISTRKANESHNSESVSSATLGGKIKSRLRESPRIRSVKQFLDRPNHYHLPFGSDGYRPQLEHFLSLLETKKTQSDIVPLALSREVIQIIGRAKKLASNDAVEARRP